MINDQGRKECNAFNWGGNARVSSCRIWWLVREKKGVRKQRGGRRESQGRSEMWESQGPFHLETSQQQPLVGGKREKGGVMRGGDKKEAKQDRRESSGEVLRASP